MAAIAKNNDLANSNLSTSEQNIARLREDKSIISFSPASGFPGISRCTSTAFDKKGKPDELSASYNWYDYDPKQVTLDSLLSFLESQGVEYPAEYVLEQFQNATKTKARNSKALELRQSRETASDPIKQLLKQAKNFAVGSKQSDFLAEQMRKIMEQVDAMGNDSSATVDEADEAEE